MMAAYAFAWLVMFGYIWSLWPRLERVEREIADVARRVGSGGRADEFGKMTAAHFIFIPAVLLVGIVIGWILGSRAAADAYAAELRRREERAEEALTASRHRHDGHDGRASTGRKFRDPSPSVASFVPVAVAEYRDDRPVDATVYRPTASRLARLAGRPAARMRRCAASTRYAHAAAAPPTVALVVVEPNAARGSPSRGWPTEPTLIR